MLATPDLDKKKRIKVYISDHTTKWVLLIECKNRR